MNADHEQTSTSGALALDDAARERLARAYALPSVSTNAAVWDDILARAGTDSAPIAVIEIDRLLDGTRSQHDAYVVAIVSAAARVGGAHFAVTDILEPGTGDLLPYLAYSGGVATLLTFPSRAAYLTALLSDAWQAGLDARRAAVADAIVLIAGENTIPPMARAMFGEPRPASDFPTPNIDGKSPPTTRRPWPRFRQMAGIPSCAPPSSTGS